MSPPTNHVDISKSPTRLRLQIRPNVILFIDARYDARYPAYHPTRPLTGTKQDSNHRTLQKIFQKYGKATNDKLKTRLAASSFAVQKGLTCPSTVQLCCPRPMLPSNPLPAAQLTIRPARPAGEVILQVLEERIHVPIHGVTWRSGSAGEAGAAVTLRRRQALLVRRNAL